MAGDPSSLETILVEIGSASSNRGVFMSLLSEGCDSDLGRSSGLMDSMSSLSAGPNSPAIRSCPLLEWPMESPWLEPSSRRLIRLGERDCGLEPPKTAFVKLVTLERAPATPRSAKEWNVLDRCFCSLVTPNS